jgi:hypothetical protein
MIKISLSYPHYYYLNVLRLLRRETTQQAIEFLYSNVEENSDNWIDKRFAHYSDRPPKEIDVSSLDFKVNEASLMQRIQGLPSGIKPVTDGPYSLDVSFEEDAGYTIINLLGYKIYDFKKTDQEISYDLPRYRLIEDKFPFAMTMQQYYVYRRAG